MLKQPVVARAVLLNLARRKRWAEQDWKNARRRLLEIQRAVFDITDSKAVRSAEWRESQCYGAYGEAHNSYVVAKQLFEEFTT